MSEPTCIEMILQPQGVSGMRPNMPRLEYDAIRRLNASSLCAGLIGVRDIDVRAIRDGFGVQRTFTTAKQDQLDCGTLGLLAE